MNFFFSTLYGQATPTNSDFLNLKSSLKSFISTNSEVNIRLLARMSFHDMIDFQPGTNQGTGCLIKQSVLNFSENQGLSNEVQSLQKFVTSKFPTTNFTFGDVVTLAGKVAFETAYPCIQIKWRFGRSQCTGQNEQEGGASGSVNSLSQFQPFLTRYGLSAQEMAILTAGAHGLATSSAHIGVSGFGNFDFAEVNSGKDWILQTINTGWKAIQSSAGNLQFLSRSNLLRLPSDLVFFPDVVAKSGGGNVDHSADAIQSKMQNYAQQYRSQFDNDFAQVYSKLLEVGANTATLQNFVEPQSTGTCSPASPAGASPIQSNNNSPPSNPLSTGGTSPFQFGNLFPFHPPPPPPLFGHGFGFQILSINDAQHLGHQITSYLLIVFFV